MALDEKYPLALPQGTILAGQYVIERVLGQGGFGITYKAIDHKTGRSVAVKEFFPDTMASRTTQTMVTAFSGERGESFAYGKGCFLQEAETLAEFIGNESIVRVYSYFEENGTAYFVMEFIEGTSFEEYIKGHGGKVPYEEAEGILLPVIDALSLVHARGIVHRDVTPDNIYITKDGRVKLLDFGAARYSLGDKSRSLDVVLKHGFAPKEQYTRHGRQGAYTDVYTVGATFYFAITGRRPPDSIDRLEEDDLIPPGSLGVKIPPYKEDAILKAMSVQPSNRYQTMGEFRQALMAGETGTQAIPAQGAVAQPVVQQRVFTTSQPTPMPPQPIQPVSMPQPIPMQPMQQPVPAKEEERKKKKWLIPAASGAAVLLAVVGVVVALSGGRGRTPDNVTPSYPAFSDTVADNNFSQSGTATTERTESALPDEPVVEVTAVNPVSASVIGNGTTSAKIRQNASTTSQIIAMVKNDMALTITGMATGTDGYTWYQVVFISNGAEVSGFVRCDLTTVKPEELTPLAGLAGSSGASSSGPPANPADSGGIYADENGNAEGRMGDVMHTCFFDYTVNSAYLCDKYEGYVQEGYEFLVADVTIRNTSTSTLPMFDTDFQIQWNDDAADAYDVPITYSLGGETLNDQMLPGDYDLAVNKTVKGLLVYLVPAGNKDFSISYLEEFNDGSKGDVFFVYFSADKR